MADNRNRAPTWVTGAGFCVLTLSSALVIYRARGDAASILFVAGSYLALLLLFGCLRAYERAAPGSPARERARRAVWPLTTLITVAFAWKEAAMMPSAAAGAVVWGLAIATTVGGFCALFPSPRAGDRQHMDRQSALAMTAFGVLTCDSALAIHDIRGDAGSKAFVFVAYAGLATTITLFLREFNYRANGVEKGQDEGRGVGSHEAANGDHVRVEGGAVSRGRGGLGDGGGHSRRRVLQLALAMTAFGVLTCDSALAVHDIRGDAGSKAFVFVAYASLATTITLFLREFNYRANGVEQGQDEGRGVGGVA